MARKPTPKRKRDYKAEYARRIARATAAGKTRQAARGHKPKEHVVRQRRSISKYGASPSTMTRLRNQAKEKLMAVYRTVAKNPMRVSDRTVARGMRLLHADDLRTLIARDDIEIVNMTKELSPLDTEADSYHEQLAQYFPVSVDEIDAADFNPGWYHR